MNAEFKKLHDDWYKSICFLSHSQFQNQQWKDLLEWSKEHKKEAVDGIVELLKEEPNWVVQLCDELFPDIIKVEGFMPLEPYCNLWLNILTKVQEYNETGESSFDINNTVDYYKDYREYMKYMETHYIAWNPYKEEDPNITLEEFKQGKRNSEELLKQRKEELEAELKKRGYKKDNNEKSN